MDAAVFHVDHCPVCGALLDRDLLDAGQVWCPGKRCPLARPEEPPYDDACAGAVHVALEVVSRALAFQDAWGQEDHRSVLRHLEHLLAGALSG